MPQYPWCSGPITRVAGTRKQKNKFRKRLKLLRGWLKPGGAIRNIDWPRILDHARVALVQAEFGREAARKAARQAKPTFVLGFLTGQEIGWLPEAINVLRGELPNPEVTVLSQNSPWLSQALTREG